MGFEQDVLTRVTEARANAVAAGARGRTEAAAAQGALTGALRSLFAVVENYPDLKASANVGVAAVVEGSLVWRAERFRGAPAT